MSAYRRGYAAACRELVDIIEGVADRESDRTLALVGVLCALMGFSVGVALLATVAGLAGWWA